MASMLAFTFVPLRSLPAEKDAAKIKKLREKQEKQQMAAFRAHQVRGTNWVVAKLQRLAW